MEATRQAVWNKTGGRCAYCGMSLTPDSVETIEGKYASWMQVDHVQPKAKGGLHAFENMMPACRSCNTSKGHKSLEEYRHSTALRKAGWPRLTDEVVEWLNANHFQFPSIPHHAFWFEGEGATGAAEKEIAA